MTIEAGEVILRSEPFCAILEGQAVQSHCSFCFFRIESDELLKCSACRLTRYCDEECKLQDVESHQDECSILAENPDICDSVRMVVKLILKLDRNKECGVDNAEVYSGGTRSFEDLMSHKEHLSQEGENFTLIQKFHRVMSGLLGPKAPNFETFLEIYGRLIINGFEICDGNQSIKGWGLYLAPSILDHSCAPNATVSFLGRTIFVRTLVDMESPLKWNEVRISYIDLMETSEMRQKKLLEQYQFHCDCPRCVSSTRQLIFNTEGSKPCLPKSEALLYCMRCQHCSGRPVYIGPPEPDLSMASISNNNNNNNNNHCPNICQNCEQPPSMEHLKKYYQIYEKVDHALERDTGVRFVKRNRVIQMDIEQAQALPEGAVNETTKGWKLAPSLDISKATPEEMFTMSYKSRDIDLDLLEVPKHSVVTGIRFRDLGGHINMEIQATPIEFLTGNLKEEQSVWIGNDNTPASSNPRKYQHIIQPDVPTRNHISRIMADDNQFVRFDTSDVHKDAMQMTIPYIDAQPVATNPGSWLSGLGLYYKGRNGYGGFVGPMIQTFDFSGHLLPKESKTTGFDMEAMKSERYVRVLSRQRRQA